MNQQKISFRKSQKDQATIEELVNDAAPTTISVPEPELVEVRVCENLEEHFGDVAREDDNDNLDEDGGFDIWDDDAIPDLLSATSV